MDFRFFLTCFGLMLAIIINVGLKDLYNRERPFEEMRWAYEFSSSFPSGHSTAAGFLYTFLIYLVYHLDIKKWKKSSFTVGAVLLIILVKLPLFKEPSSNIFTLLGIVIEIILLPASA